MTSLANQVSVNEWEDELHSEKIVKNWQYLFILTMLENTWRRWIEKGNHGRMSKRGAILKYKLKCTKTLQSYCFLFKEIIMRDD